MTAARKPTHTVREFSGFNLAAVLVEMAERAGYALDSGEIAGEFMIACCSFAVRNGDPAQGTAAMDNMVAMFPTVMALMVDNNGDIAAVRRDLMARMAAS